MNEKIPVSSTEAAPVTQLEEGLFAQLQKEKSVFADLFKSPLLEVGAIIEVQSPSGDTLQTRVVDIFTSKKDDRKKEVRLEVVG